MSREMYGCEKHCGLFAGWRGGGGEGGLEGVTDRGVDVGLGGKVHDVVDVVVLHQVSDLQIMKGTVSVDLGWAKRIVAGECRRGSRTRSRLVMSPWQKK
jgi:hypothetical protein